MTTLQRKAAVISLGSNLGDRLANVLKAVAALSDADINVTKLSRLYETAPAYVTDQPAFLNAAALVTTPEDLDPLELLQRVKLIEKSLGRNLQGGVRYGPRPIDLDIIFHDDGTITEKETLLVPHPRWQERDFVKAPLADLYDPLSSPFPCRESLRVATHLWEAAGGEAEMCLSKLHDLRCVLPMGRLGLWPWQQKTMVMGVLNITPDSFSDGGRLDTSVKAALEVARRLVAEGVDILDVGGQSTRPGAAPVTAREEAERVLPVVKAISSDPMTAHTPLSIDTYYGQVALAAVGAGATMVNDVSGGQMDPDMFNTVAELGVSYVLMHMRGNPRTMQKGENIQYGEFIPELTREIASTATKAVNAGIEPWRIVIDPGIGFAKTQEHNVDLLGGGLTQLKKNLPPPLNRMPMLIGPSRKGFLGKITGRELPGDRDTASAAAAALSVIHGANIIRAHNVAAVKDAVLVADAVNRRGVAASAQRRSNV